MKLKGRKSTNIRDIGRSHAQARQALQLYAGMPSNSRRALHQKNEEDARRAQQLRYFPRNPG